MAATALSAQPAPPQFKRESVLPVWGKHTESLMPNELVAIYGRHLMPASGRPQPSPPAGVAYPTHGSIAPADSPRGRLPLHLQYRFDTPGKYEIRFIGFQLQTTPGKLMQPVQIDESDWTEIELLPYTGAQRAAWIQDQVSKMPSSPGLLVGDAIPSLLAVPDELALRAILPELYHSDDLVRRYVAAALPLFDSALLRMELTKLVREKGPTEEIARILDAREDLFEGGHAALLSLLPPFLKSTSPLVQAGALLYLAWAQNHDWGKTPEFRNQLSTTVLEAAPAILDRGDAQSQQMLSIVLGSIHSDDSRNLL